MIEHTLTETDESEGSVTLSCSECGRTLTVGRFDSSTLDWRTLSLEKQGNFFVSHKYSRSMPGMEVRMEAR